MKFSRGTGGRQTDTGLGIERSKNLVIVSVISRPRTEEMKTTFFQRLCQELQQSCGIAPADVIATITINSSADWSFGLGRAQFLTGELS